MCVANISTRKFISISHSALRTLVVVIVVFDVAFMAAKKPHHNMLPTRVELNMQKRFTAITATTHHHALHKILPVN